MATCRFICRATGSEAFRDALTDFVRRELAGSAQWIEVVIDQQIIRVSWRGAVEPEDALQSALARLKSGDQKTAQACT